MQVKMAEECKKEQNLKNCNCTYPCDKKGLCCECLQYHLKRKELPACCFSKNEERSYDRSFKNFVRLVNKD